MLAQSPNVLTRQNDIGRTGRQLDENTLNTTNVTATGNSFGKVFTYSVSGQIYAQPLTVTNINVTGCHASPHCNVVYVATENDMLYAFDADGNASSTSPLWSANLATNVGSSYSYLSCVVVFSGCTSNSALYPNIGVTGTPVIDVATNTLYVVSAIDCRVCAYPLAGVFDYLHAINILTGAEKLGGPMQIAASVTGAASPPATCTYSSTSGTVYFNAAQQLQRPGLLELSASATGYTHPVIYIGFSIYDGNPSASAGWVLGYDANTLAQVAAFNTAPFGTGGGIWESGEGLTAATNGDGKTYIYVPIADGTFDVNTGGSDYGDSMIKLGITQGVLSPNSYFAPSDAIGTTNRCLSDTDFGSGGAMALPDVSVPNHSSLIVHAEKEGYLWVLDRDVLGSFQGAGGQPVQQVDTKVLQSDGSHIGGYWTSPAYYEWGTSPVNKAIYYTIALRQNAQPPPLNQYVLDSADPIPTSAGYGAPTHSTSTLFCAPVPTPSVSATPTNTNGILWAVEDTNSTNAPPTPTCKGSPAGAILHAYDATNVHNAELYNSGTHIQGNTPSKFLPPTVFNGRVYLGTYQGVALGGTTGELDVFGLCASGPQGVCIP